MKTYSHLYEQLISDENIKLAIHNASLGSKNKRAKKKLLKMRENVNEYIPRVRKYILNYVGKLHKQKEIYDGISRKKRKIVVPNVWEQVYCHAIVNVLKPIFMKGTFVYAYGSIPGRGSHDAKKVIERWIRNQPEDCVYCLKMDIKKYFPSIPQERLKAKLSRIIKDKRFLDRVFELFKVQEKGIPLGFYTSQWFAIWYLQDFDHWVKEKLGAKKYVRWMDDMAIFHQDKNVLHEFRKRIDVYLQSEFGVRLNHKWQVFLFDRGKIRKRQIGRDLDYMGFRFYHNRTILRRALYYKACRKAEKVHRKSKPTVYDCKQMITYFAWTKVANVYKMYCRYIKSKVDFRYMRKRISNYDRRVKNNVVQFRKYSKAA